jgi:membrane protease subunit HflK
MDINKEPFDFDKLRHSNVSGSAIRNVALGIVAAILLFTSWYTVSPDEAGVVQRFGAYVRVTGPGLNFKLPLGMERVTKVPVERQLKHEFGFRTLRADVRTEFEQRTYKEESLMLTGDLNAAEVEWIVQYRISDPYRYLFKVRNTEQTFRDLNEAMMREIVGDRSVNEVLTIGRQEIANAVEGKLQALCDQYETGIRVEQVVLQDVTPPDEVKPSFNEVNEAQQEREKMINQARSEYNKIIPKADGEAMQIIEEARGYALERVNKAQGDAARFTAMFKEYMKAREVTRQRIYLETMEEVLSKVGKKLITDDKAQGILPLFQFDGKGEVKHE